jgi:hypothetical protein
MTAFKKELHKEKANKIVERTYTLKGAKLINSNIHSIVLINGITFRGVLTVIDAGSKFHPIDEIWLIMKSIFEGKSFTISKKG